jgi:hypothetical protein
MKKRTPKPRDGPRPSDSFKAFQETVKRLLTVSKQELDERLAADRIERRKKRAERRATGHGPPVP